MGKKSLKNWSSLNNRVCLISLNRKALTCLLVLFLVKLDFAQTFTNLVPNGSFETYTNCPNNSSQVYFAPPWTGPTNNSTDFYHACANPNQFGVPYFCGVGSSYPCYLPAVNNGNGYAGIHTYMFNNREYLEVPLNTTLEAGKCYYGEFYTTSATYNKYCVNNIAGSFGSVIHTTTLSTGPVLNLFEHIINYGNPVFKDTLNWQKISGLYQANGTESILTIGNFRSDSNTDTVNLYLPGTNPYYNAATAYNNIDAVSVYSVDPTGILPWTYRDTTASIGDSVYIGNAMGGIFTSSWFTYGGSFINSGPGIYVKPVSTSTYVVQFTVCGVPRSDTLVVTITGTGINELDFYSQNIKLYPNPAQDILNIELGFKSKEKYNKVLILDNLSQVIREEDITFSDNKAVVNIKNIANGVYILQVVCSNSKRINKRLVIID